MENEKSFPFSVDFEGQHYKGMVTPSDEISNTGMPVYFRVTIGDQLFAYLCCGDHGWLDRDGSGQPEDLTQAIGNFIGEYYELHPERSHGTEF